MSHILWPKPSEKKKESNRVTPNGEGGQLANTCNHHASGVLGGVTEIGHRTTKRILCVSLDVVIFHVFKRGGEEEEKEIGYNNKVGHNFFLNGSSLRQSRAFSFRK